VGRTGRCRFLTTTQPDFNMRMLHVPIRDWHVEELVTVRSRELAAWMVVIDDYPAVWAIE
jgi:hypothetical protein